MLVRRIAVTAMPFAMLACFLAAGSVRAACGVTSSAIAQADAVFVGLLTDVDENGTATFQVEEVWRGDMLESGSTASVEASQSGLEVGPAGTTFRYLVLAGDRAGTLHVGDDPANACSLFAFPWDASYAEFRPANAPVDPEPSADGGALPILPLVIGAAVVIAVAAFAVGSSGRRPRPG
ncbi:MAG TPA: hypothetical protein VFH90_07335 [Candidatus Limnocylindria bacterium]|nr:hypothetical protein [Candidatus Limnocylindria bacterium]